MSIIAKLCLALAPSMIAATAQAANVPPQLYNKAITVAWIVSVNATAEDGTVGHGLSHQRIIYISSKGNIFARHDRSGRRGMYDSKDRGPDETGGTYSYQGGHLVGFGKMLGGASLLTVSFDSAFQSCTAAIQFGKSGGEDYKAKAPNGKIYTIHGAISASTPTCSMRDGNPFAE
jgi:hypothetical protein